MQDINYAATVLRAHLCLFGPRTYGGKDPITPGHRASVTAGLPQFTLPSFSQVQIYQLDQLGRMNGWVDCSLTTQPKLEPRPLDSWLGMLTTTP